MSDKMDGGCSLPPVSAEDEAHFQSWMKEFNKEYEPAEYQRRLRIFLETKRMVDEHNAGNHSFTMGLNQFSDLTPEEFRNTYLMKKPVYHIEPRLGDSNQED
ncbi:pro-cathepsin H-like [Macrotis lagotis]|uniref:pro-cathepsin H-like n=1 Tax=Macrotis lagotis TaxID=92651 RepID=UPI003D688947